MNALLVAESCCYLNPIFDQEPFPFQHLMSLNFRQASHFPNVHKAEDHMNGLLLETCRRSACGSSMAYRLLWAILRILKIDPNRDFKCDNSLIGVATEMGHCKSVKLLLDSGANANDGLIKLTALLRANPLNSSPFETCRNDIWDTRLEVVKLLLHEGVDPCVTYENGMNFLQAAVQNKWTSAALIASEHFCKTNSAADLDSDIVMDAIESSQFELVDKFFSCGFDPNTPIGDCASVLHYAVVENNLALINVLIKYRANVNRVDSAGETPIFASIRHTNLEAFSLLLTAGPNLTIKDSEGNTPLHLSAQAEDNAFLKALLNSEVGLDVTNNENQTPPHLATWHKRLWNLNALIQAGADVDKTDRFGNTALHLAIYNSDFHSAKLLIDAGADPTIVNGETKSAIDLCASLIVANDQDQSGRSDTSIDSILKLLVLDDNRLSMLCDWIRSWFDGANSAIEDVLGSLPEIKRNKRGLAIDTLVADFVLFVKDDVERFLARLKTTNIRCDELELSEVLRALSNVKETAQLLQELLKRIDKRSKWLEYDQFWAEVRQNIIKVIEANEHEFDRRLIRIYGNPGASIFTLRPKKNSP